jgi:hypothetical protein
MLSDILGGTYLISNCDAVNRVLVAQKSLGAEVAMVECSCRVKLAHMKCLEDPLVGFRTQ